MGWYVVVLLLMMTVMMILLYQGIPIRNEMKKKMKEESDCFLFYVQHFVGNKKYLDTKKKHPKRYSSLFVVDIDRLLLLLLGLDLVL